MEVKAGQIYLDGTTDMTVRFVSEFSAIVEYYGGEVEKRSLSDFVNFELINDNSQPSDLEIVQKALKTVGKYGGTLVFQDDGSCLIYEYPKMTGPHVIGFAECSNLLTWAKQRIGVA